MGVAGKIVSTALGALGLGTIICLAVENSQLVDDYNNLVDNTNDLKAFIRNHDFYKRPAATPSPAKKARRQGLKKVDEFVDENGRNVCVYQDENSGFKVYEFGKSKKDA